MGGTVLYIGYEIALLVLGWAVASRFWRPGLAVGASVSPSGRLFVALAVSIFIGCFLPMVALFSPFSEKLALQIVAFGSIAAAGVASFMWRPHLGADLGQRDTRGVIVVAVLALFAGYLVETRILALFESDSQEVFRDVVSWMNGTKTPYSIFWNYVSFWETSYTPGLVLADSKAFLWWPSFKAALLLGVGVFAIGRLAGAPLLLAGVVAFSAVLAPSLWGPFSGVPTLKNDAIANAGILVCLYVVLRLLQGPHRLRFLAVLFGLGIAFMTTKYSGVLQGVLFGVWMLVLIWRASPPEKRLANVALFSALSIGVFGVSTLHYYIKNMVVFGNPLFPIQMTLGPITLPGTWTQKGTSILENAQYGELWRLLLAPRDGEFFVHRQGVFWPLYFLLSPLVLALMVWRRKSVGPAVLAVAATAFVAWLIYLASTFSSGMEPRVFFFIENLNTMRYVSAATGLSILAVALAAVRGLRAPLVLVAAVLGLEALVKAVSLFLPGVSAPTLRLTGFSVVFAVAAILLYAAWLNWRKPAANVVMAGAGLGLASVALMMSPTVLANNAKVAWTPFAGAENMIDQLSPRAVIALVKPYTPDAADGPQSLGAFRPMLIAHTYHALGSNLSRQLIPFKIGQTTKPPPGAPDRIVVAISTLGRTERIEPTDQAALDTWMAGGGWRRVQGDLYAAVYAFAPSVDAYPADCKAVESVQQGLQAKGCAVLLAAPNTIVFQDGENRRTLATAGPGARLLPSQQFPFDLVLGPEGPLMPSATFRTRLAEAPAANCAFRPDGSLNAASWSVSTDGAYRLDTIGSGASRKIRITLTGKANWLALIGLAPKDDSPKLWSMVTDAAASAGAKAGLSGYDLVDGKADQTVRRSLSPLPGAAQVISASLRNPDGRDYFDVGIASPQVGQSLELTNACLAPSAPGK